MNFKRKIFVSLLTLLISTGIYAEQVTYEFHAVVEQIIDPGKVLSGQVEKGEKLRGTYTFNTKSPDTDSSPQFGHFNQINGNGNGFDLHINQLATRHETMGERLFHSITTGNGDIDFYYVESKSMTPLGSRFAINHIALEVFDHTGSALSSDQLNQDPPNIDAAEDKNILISGLDIQSKSQFDLKATIVSFSKVVKLSEND